MKKKLFRDEYLVNPNCTHYEIDPDDTPVPDEYDNYGCDCDIHSPPPPARLVYPRPINPYYHGPAPFINAPFVFPAPPPPPHARMHPVPPPPPPPMPRGKRKPIEPDIDDPVMGEYLKPEKHYAQWLIKQLELYPRLNDSCVVQGLWSFCKDLHIRNPHACINSPAKWNQDRLESSVVFTDHCDKELGRITLYKLKTGETGLELSIGDGKSLGLRDIEGGVISHAPTPEDIDDNEIATVGWVRDALLQLLQEATDPEPTEGSDKFVDSGGIYTWVTNLFQRKLTFDDTPTNGSTNPVTSDGIYDAIEAVRITLDPTVTENSQNGVTSEGIYDFVTNAISGIEFPQTTLPIASKTQKGIMQVGDYLTVANGLVSVDIEAIKTYLGLTAFTDANFSSVSNTFDWLSSGGGSANADWSSLNTSVLGNVLGAGNAFLTPHLAITVSANGEYMLRSNWGTNSSPTYRDAVDIGTRIYCRNTTTQVTKSYVPLRTVIVYNGTRYSGGGTEPGGIYWQNVTIRAWYKSYDYTLTANDITAINAEADAFAASYQLGYDTGAVS